MQLLHFLSPVVLAALASARSIRIGERAGPLDVSYEVFDGTNVRATIINNRDSPIKLFKLNSILDDDPVEKVEIRSGGEQVNFVGIRKVIDMTALSESDFHQLGAGESISAEWNAAATHDFGAGGDFDVSLAVQNLHFADANSTSVSGSVPFSSQPAVRVNVDSTAAAQARGDRQALMRRLTVRPSCNADQHNQLKEAINNCKNLALGAQNAALSGHDNLMNQYFKGSDSGTKNTVRIMLQGVANSCGSSNSGTWFECSAPSGLCGANVLAVTVFYSDGGVTVFSCPGFWPLGQSTTCGGYSKGNVIVHESTHLYGTKDVSYGCSQVQSLSHNDAVNNADTYRCFVNAVAVC